MPKAKHNEFKRRLAQIDKDYGPVERGVWFWVEHAMHWYLFFFTLVVVLTYAYLLFDHNSVALAQIVFPN